MHLILGFLISCLVIYTKMLVVSRILPENQMFVGCGIANSSHGRIIGGYDVGYYKYSWFAALKHLASGQIVCAGTLITSFHVLSAAHCFASYPKKNYTFVYDILLGTTNLCKKESRSQSFKTQRVLIHEMYKHKQPYYDVSLITLERKASDFTPICLPNYVPLDVSIPYVEEGWVIGYGQNDIKQTTKFPCELQEARVLIYSNNVCVKVLTDEYEKADDIKGVVCAGYLSGGIDACQGDSGGPLQILGKNNQYIIQGIVSFGYGCAEKNTLGIYTDVAKYVDWINNNLEDNQIINNNENYTPFYYFWPYYYYYYWPSYYYKR